MIKENEGEVPVSIEVSVRHAAEAQEVFRDGRFSKSGTATSTTSYEFADADIADDFVNALKDAKIPTKEIHVHGEPHYEKRKRYEKQYERHTKSFAQFLNEGAGKGRTPEVAKKIADDTIDSYSYGRYSRWDWVKIADYLYKHGFTVDAVKCIMMSKYMRWYGEIQNANSGGEKTHTYALFVKDFDKLLSSEKEKKAIEKMIEEDGLKVYREEFLKAAPVDESKSKK